jgi:glucarate dehydratase
VRPLGADLGQPLQQPLRHLARHVHPGGGGGAGTITALDTHWIWQDGQRLTAEPPLIRGGEVRVPERPGLGVDLDEAALAAAHALYRSLPAGARNDATAMQYLIEGWTFDPKRPALVR